MLASSAGGPEFNPQSRTGSYQRRYKNGTSSSLVWHSTLKKGNTGSFSIIKIKSEIEIPRSRRSLAVVAGMKKTNDHAEPTKIKR